MKRKYLRILELLNFLTFATVEGLECVDNLGNWRRQHSLYSQSLSPPHCDVTFDLRGRTWVITDKQSQDERKKHFCTTLIAFLVLILHTNIPNQGGTKTRIFECIPKFLRFLIQMLRVRQKWTNCSQIDIQRKLTFPFCFHFLLYLKSKI